MLRSSKDLEDELTQDIPKDDGSSISKSVINRYFRTRRLNWKFKTFSLGRNWHCHSLGIDELIIGLTIVAIGTSLPELAASITSAIKGHHDIAIGNILGSNLFNLATVLPLPAIIAPSILTESVMQRDYWWMLATTLAFIGLITFFSKTKRKSIPSWTGYLLLMSYLVYLISLYMSTMSI